jgi:hypothetical protein
MSKTELEKVIFDISKKLDQGIKVTVQDHRSTDAVTHGLITGAAFMIGSIAIQEIRNTYVRHKNKKWFKNIKEEES